MRALTGHNTKDVCIDQKPAPKILDVTDIITKVASTAICGSDLHIYDVFIPLGIASGKGLSFKMVQIHMQKYMPRLLSLIEEEKIDPRFVITYKYEYVKSNKLKF